MNKLRLFFLFFALLSISLSAQNKAIEVRAVWLTTNWGLDWPTPNKSTEQQKEQLRKILDEFKQLNFNVVLFQARARGNAFYRSSIEPLSPYFSKGDNFDPLAFAIEECHRRGMECHAWLVAFPMEREARPIPKGKQTVAAQQKPPFYKLIDDDQWHMDPGHPGTKERIKAIVREVVTNYDVDGVHFDYIRYPNANRTFPDQDTYRMYGKGKNLYDWRRDNINNIVFEVYDMVKSLKSWVQVSSAPLGRYKVLPDIRRNDGWTAYEIVFQDAGYWMESGKQDMLFPMMYHRKRFFTPYLNDWLKHSNGRPIVSGLGVYQMDDAEMKWSLADITEQMTDTREQNAAGQAYFRAANILNDLKGIKGVLKRFYPYPAKLPPMTWLDNTIPSSPPDLLVYRSTDGLLHIEWRAPSTNEGYTYNIYFSDKDSFDPNDPRQLLATGIHGTSFVMPIVEGDFGIFYSVSASDRYHNESQPTQSAFFIHTPYIK